MVPLWVLVLLATAPGPCEAAETVAPQGPARLAVLGDSLTAGYGLDPGDAFPIRLQEALRQVGHSVRVLDHGVSGDTTAGGAARLEWMLEDRPDAVIVELGGNDALRGLAPESVEDHLGRILRALEARGIPTLLVGMRAPRNLGEGYAAAFAAVYQRLAQQYRVLFYPFFLEGVAGITELNQSDGIHPNAQGVSRVVANLLPLVEQLLARIRTPAAATGQ